MNNSKWIVGLVIAFLVGFFVRPYLMPTTLQPKMIEDEQARIDQLKEAKNNLIKISETEYQEYTKIKDMKLKYEKADELLGRVMLLFLADIGFKLREQTTGEPALATGPTDNPPTTTETPSPAKIETAAAQQASPATDPRSQKYKAASLSIRSTTAESAVKSNLDDLVRSNLKMDIAQGSTVNTTQIKRLTGTYQGTIDLLDTSKGSYNVLWDLRTNDDSKEKGPVGQFTLKIWGNKKNSEHNGNGTIRNITNIADDTSAYLVQSCGDDCILQLYYNEGLDQLIGNYYELDKDDRFQRVGRIFMHR